MKGMEAFEDIEKLYDKAYKEEVVAFMLQKIEQDDLFYICEYAEDGGVAYELKGDKILRHICFGGFGESVKGVTYNKEASENSSEYVRRELVKKAMRHGGLKIEDATNFERLWDKREVVKPHRYTIKNVCAGASMLVRSILKDYPKRFQKG